MKKVLLFWGVVISVIISTANAQVFKLVKDINTTAALLPAAAKYP